MGEGKFTRGLQESNPADEFLMKKGRNRADRFGLYRGIVEYNRDPEQRGRVFVRVLEDGPEMQITDPETPRVSTFDLGWCEPCFPFAGGKGYGTFSVPPVGSRVFVLYVRGCAESPVYFGGWYANPDKQKRYGSTKTTLEPRKDADGEYIHPPQTPPYWGEYWMEEQGNESPLETCEMVGNQPDTHTVFKTLKGAAIFIKERNSAEELTIVDRLGGELRFESFGSGDGLQRRIRQSATQLRTLGTGGVQSRYKMSLLNPERQGLVVENDTDGDSFVHLHNGTNLSKTPETSPERVSIELDKGEQRLRVTYMSGGSPVGHLTLDLVASELVLEGVGVYNLRLDSPADINITAPNIRLNGTVTIDGEIRSVNNSKFSFIDNDIEPYGSQFRNMWPHDDTDQAGVYPRRDTIAARRDQAQHITFVEGQEI